MSRIPVLLLCLVAALCALLAAGLARATSIDAVRATLDRLTLWSGDRDEPPAERAERLRTLSVAIAAASSTDEESAFLLALGEAETHFGAYTQHPGRCVAEGPAGARCDRGKAYGYWSLHFKACPSVWSLPPEDERAVYVSAQCAVQLYRFGRHTCGRGDVAGWFNVYAGRRCNSTKGHAQARAQRFRQVLSLLGHGGVPWPSEPP